MVFWAIGSLAYVAEYPGLNEIMEAQSARITSKWGRNEPFVGPECGERISKPVQPVKVECTRSTLTFGLSGHDSIKYYSRMQAHGKTLRTLHAKLHRVRRAGFPATGLLELQSDVLHKIVRLEKRTRDLRTKRALNKKRLSGSFGARLSKAEAAEVKRSVARDEAGVNVCQCLLRLTRSIADGLAFSVLPKWDIKPLSFKETAGFISGKQGLPLELRILRELLRKGEIALLNDITNCLRHGDITVPRMPSPAIIEVKSGSAENSRARRQMAKAEEIAAYLSTDVSNNWQGTGWTVTRRSLAQGERHHRRRLVNLVRICLAIAMTGTAGMKM
jgi:hypothetical protein